MVERLSIEEKYSPHWSRITLGLSLFTVIAFITYTVTGDPLWKGYVRLVAFCGMAATIFSALKVMQGKCVAEMTLENGILSIDYHRKKRRVVHDRYELNNIRALMVKHRRSGTPGVDLLVKDRILVAELKNADRPVHFLEVEGRPFPLSKQSSERLIEFILAQAPHIEVVNEYDGANKS